jgi:flagellar biosynthesis/type III secretory pathway protein FliH
MAVIRGGKRKARAPADDENAVEAQEILDAAERAGEKLLQLTRGEVQEMVTQGAAQGQQEGFAEAEHLRSEISGLEQRMVKEVEGEVVRAALRVAREVIEAELKAREDAIVDLVCAALSTARDARDVFLRVSPRDAGILREHKARLIDALGRARDVEIREDRKVSPGGVLIQTEAGVIDAQLETQLEEISTVLGA